MINYVKQGSITAASQALTPIDLGAGGFGNLTVQITGTWTGTIQFQCGIDGVLANVQSLAMYALSTAPSTIVTTATANGVFRTLDATGINIYISSTSATWTGTAVVTVYWNEVR